MAALVAAAEAGRTQRDIAAALNVTQPRVTQLLARARRRPQSWQRDPRQIGLEYAAGELTHAQMVKELVEWPWTYGHLGDADSAWPEGYMRGSWDELHGLEHDGLISAEDYAYINEHVPAQ